MPHSIDGLAQQALDALEDAIIVWLPCQEQVELVNARAKASKLLERQGTRVGDELVHAAEEHREWRGLYDRLGVRPPTVRLNRRGQTWYLRTAPLAAGREVLVARPDVMREAALLQELQRRYGITDRQADVLRGLVRGLSTREVAAKLDLAPRTVRRHEEALRQALHARNNYELLQIVESIRHHQR